MQIMISPAKNMCRQPPTALPPGWQCTGPHFSRQPLQLARALKKLDPWQLEQLMHINPQLALRAYDDFQHFSDGCPPVPALLCYQGLQYKNIDPATLDTADIHFLQQRLYIVSALYGLLRPCDGVRPYRLEMGLRWHPTGGKDLYAYWGGALCRQLFSHRQPVLDLASKEYSRAIVPYLAARHQLISCDFLVSRPGGLKTVATIAKQARGQMVRFIARNQIDDPLALRAFSWQGFAFAPALSTPDRLVFVRQAP